MELAINKLKRNIAKGLATHHHFGRLLRILGPGLVTGAADDDPSGIATYSQAGAMFGYAFLWAFPVMYPLLLSVQESCARIGAINGKGLAAVIKDHYGKKMLYVAVFLVVAANTINIGADLGAMAATTKLVLPGSYSFYAIFFALVIVLLEVTTPYKKYAKILKWLAITLFAYPITAFIIKESWGEILSATIHPKLSFSFDQLYILVGMIGTTISPYLFFWDTSEIVEEEYAKHRINKDGDVPKITKRFLRNIRLDNIVGMTLASVSAWFIVVACASVLFKNGTQEITTAADAARALEPLVSGFPNAGLIAKLIFSIGIIGLGLLAVPVLAGSSSYAISEAFGWREGFHRKFKKARGFYFVIILATLVGLVINFLGIDPIKALVFTAVFNGISSIPLLFMIRKIGNNEAIMGQYKNGPLSNAMVSLSFGVVSISMIVLLFSFIRGTS